MMKNLMCMLTRNFRPVKLGSCVYWPWSAMEYDRLVPSCPGRRSVMMLLVITDPALLAQVDLLSDYSTFCIEE